MNIDEMTAGRKLDVLVAEKVMEWKTAQSPPDPENWQQYPNVWFTTPTGAISNLTNVPRYSANIAAAWEMINQMRKRGFFWNIHNSISGVYCFFGRDDGAIATVDAHAETAPLAICRAALKAITTQEPTSNE